MTDKVTEARDALVEALDSLNDLPLDLLMFEARWDDARAFAAAILAAIPDGWTLTRKAGVSAEYDEAVESVHRAFCFPDHETVGEWDRSMADALRRRGYAIVNQNAADCLAASSAGSRVEADAHVHKYACTTCGDLPPDPASFRPAPPPAVDGTRCGECGGVEDDVFHVPCLVGGPFHYVKTCHPFTPPTPAPADRLRTLEAALRDIAEYEAAAPVDEWSDAAAFEAVQAIAARALLDGPEP